MPQKNKSNIVKAILKKKIVDQSCLSKIEKDEKDQFDVELILK